MPGCHWHDACLLGAALPGGERHFHLLSQYRAPRRVFLPIDHGTQYAKSGGRVGIVRRLDFWTKRLIEGSTLLEPQETSLFEGESTGKPGPQVECPNQLLFSTITTN